MDPVGARHPGLVIVTPTTGCAGWPIRGGRAELRHGDSDVRSRTQASMEYVWLANFCGTPSLSVPAGYVVPEERPGAGEVAGADTEGAIPVGLMVTGERNSEDELMQVGLDVEEVCSEGPHRPPNWVDVVQLSKRGAESNVVENDH